MSIKKNNKPTDICIIGLGLIGGSLALKLKSVDSVKSITGVDINPEHRRRALSMELVDCFLPVDDAVAQSDTIILSTPVDVNCSLLPRILDMIDGSDRVVCDMGSTKADIAASAFGHPARGRYVAVHPMAGTEYSGPESALPDLFERKLAIICDQKDCDNDAFKRIMLLLQWLGMRTHFMSSGEHDVHLAYVSHISHISSFALALCVLEKEKNHRNIMSLAAGGFESTVRLSKSNADTWAPILIGNARPVIEAVDTYIEKIMLFRQSILNAESDQLRQLMLSANQIGKILESNTPKK